MTFFTYWIGISSKELLREGEKEDTVVAKEEPLKVQVKTNVSKKCTNFTSVRYQQRLVLIIVVKVVKN